VGKEICLHSNATAKLTVFSWLSVQDVPLFFSNFFFDMTFGRNNLGQANRRGGEEEKT
jgi:hypothetical protein